MVERDGAVCASAAEFEWSAVSVRSAAAERPAAAACGGQRISAAADKGTHERALSCCRPTRMLRRSEMIVQLCSVTVNRKTRGNEC